MSRASVHVAIEFLSRLAADRQAGHVAPLSEYLARHPGHEEVIAEEYLRARGRSAAGLADDEPGRVGPYELESELGRGGQAVVWRAFDPRLGRHVALKVVARSPATGDLPPRFRREARVTAGLDHPGICAVYDAGADERCTWIAMRLVDGVSLARWLDDAAARREGAPPAAADLDAVLSALEAVARALHAAHERGVVHRDVKPANVMIQPDGAPVVLDFGVAWLMDDGPRLTLTGTSLGTPAYMAPEQVSGREESIGPATDVWAVGATLYEASTGRRAFPQPTRDAVFDAILRSAPPDPRRLCASVSRDLAAVIDMAMHPLPSGRYETAEALAEDLRRLREGRPTLARPVGAVDRVRRWSRRNPLVAGLCVALAVAVVAGGTLLARSAIELSAKNRDLEGSNRTLKETAAAVRREAIAKTEALEEHQRLADGLRIRAATEEAERLFPIGPDLVPRILAWQARYADLFERLPAHERTLTELRGRARPWGEDDRLRDHAAAFDLARRLDIVLQVVGGKYVEELEGQRDALLAGTTERSSWDFGDDVDTQFRHDELAAIVEGLRALARGDDSVASDVARRLDLSRRVLDETVARHSDEWRDAAARVASRPAYGGLILAPQPGLVPLGPDPDSGLEEFLLWETHPGDPPTRDAARQLVLGEDAGIVLVLIPPAVFEMGAQSLDPAAPRYDPAAKRNEWPVRPVALEAFFMGKHEITQAQWRAATGASPSAYNDGVSVAGRGFTGRNPVERVNWRESVEVLRRLGLVLPTEAQWEYAARAGAETMFSGTSDPVELARFANVAGREVVGVFPDATDRFEDAFLAHAPVGSFAPNAFGLQDMTGNVWEWCRDRFAFYSIDPDPGDGERQAHVDNRTYRGGAFNVSLVDQRITARTEVGEELKFNSLGLRAARRLEPGGR